MKIICTTLLIEKSPQALPLGAACIASAIKHDPLTKDICTTELEVFSMEDRDYVALKNEEDRIKFISNRLLEKNPQVVAFSIFVWNRIVLEKVAAVLKTKGIFCIAGGPEVTAHPESFDVFDALSCGEGEGSVPSIIYDISKGNLKSGEKRILPSGVCQNLSFSPYLDGTLDPSEYEGALWELARGCPFKCSYCYESKGQKTVRQIPMERIQKELDLFAKKKIPQVFVLDPTYNAGKKRAIELLNLIAKKTPGTFYYFEARAEFIDRELAHAFTKIPCALQIGLQSADENVLKLVNRPFNKKQFARNIGFLNDEGVIFGLDLIYGLPGESLRGFKDGIDFAISLYPNNLETFCLSVLPGTDLFDKAKELHLTYETTPPYHVLYTDKFSKEDLAQAEKLSKACSFFYNEGRAVPWFNTICRSLKMRPAQFFAAFADYMEIHKNLIESETVCSNHFEIEKIQIDFVTQQFNQKNKKNHIKAATDLIRFNGALSRTQDTGKGESVKLSYNSEYLASQYATDLDFFVTNIKCSPCTIKTFKNGSFADWK